MATLPIVIVAAAFLSFQKSGPKFVLTDQVAPKQVSESSEIKTSGRKKLTDAERLRYNQTLINENQKFYRRGH